MTFIDGFVHQLPDTDPQETQEWLDSLDAVVSAQGEARARFLLSKVLERSRELGVGTPASVLHAVHQHHPGRPASRGSPATRTSSAASAPTSAGTPRSWSSGPTRRPTASAATCPPSPRRRAQYEVGFNHFFRGKERRPAPATPSTSRATPRPASTPAPTSRAASPRSSSTTSAWRSAATACPATRTPGSCRTSGSTPRFRWASARSTRSTRPGSSATCTTARSTTPAARGSGASSATARSTSPRPSAPSPWRPGRASTT